ncbi:hypothetical protein B1T45_01125 [Mycobacterium kansasii]|uniref:Uncharacterized protein n=2 Tax=Mycobacterium kansasii TaxID=1768 RepID=A0A653EHS3_MYCKA|nr:hypothetical protein MKAN_28055 [Mycobacterium kansasii ATCC 12478]ARG54690.1 hypothetical protein B1T43_01120 [Mycobacterium kansasii]ARG60142.1 hypothetical protein B1T45_01125 [Mycobacterium kansasii]ARG67880.1 hypothetical protein B1T47_01220 [Mycobacterium kansasii]ARG77609.1 hypothetical protein B1T51_27600 [Mycobacterium kansasii]
MCRRWSRRTPHKQSPPPPPALECFIAARSRRGDGVDKLAYDQTSNEQVVCEGNTRDKAPITTGVHAAGASCDRPDIPGFAMSASNDG